jgi:hypothetical protein
MLDLYPDSSYGLGVGQTILSSGRRVIGHDGGIPGFIAVGNFDQRSGVVVVVLTTGMGMDLFGIQDDLFEASAPQS